MHTITPDQRLRLFIDQAGDYAMIVTDPAGLVVEWSGGARQLFGWTAEDMLGKPAAAIFTPAERDAGTAQARMRAAAAAGRAAAAGWYARKDGAGVFCDGSVNAIAGADGAPLGFGWILREARRTVQPGPDAAPANRFEAELRSAEERYRTLITSIDEAFAIVQVLVDADGVPVDYRFEEVNRGFEQQSGLVDAAGKTIREMVPDIESRWIDLYGRVALTREPVRFTEHSAAMGYWWDVYAMPMGQPEERRIGILFTDVTAKRKAEENLRQLAADLSESDRRKTAFLATLAHELRNPLAPIRTGLDLISMAGRSTPGNGKVLDMMDRQLKQIVHLIDDLMDISRISSGKIVLKQDCVDLQAAIASAVETALPAIDAARHALHVQVPESTVLLWADRTRLAQILGNLLTNAVKYTPDGGRIALSARLEGDAVVVDVSDSGIGIPPEEQGRVFDMFAQVSRNLGRAQGGLGIGLSLVRSLVEMHGGAIAVASAGAGQGTTFTLRLPVHDGRAAQGAGAQAAVGKDAVDKDAVANAAIGKAAPAGPALRVLVADDNADAAHLLADLLQAVGNTTHTVYDGVRAVQAILADKPDMAILDIGMPGLNGYEVARQVRTAPGAGHIVLVALTGWGGEPDRQRSKEAGFDAHLTKPAGLDELNGIVERFFGKDGVRRASP